MKKARKVALINIFNFPRELYSAHWEITVQGDELTGYRWSAKILSNTPIGWAYLGASTTERPDMPWPTYPADLPLSATEAQVEARRKLCAEIYAAHPQPLFELDKTGPHLVMNRDDADTAAQQWVLERIGNYRKDVAPLTDDQIKEAVTEFDLARRIPDFARIDRARGRLAAHGIKLKEPKTISDPAATTWTRS